MKLKDVSLMLTLTLALLILPLITPTRVEASPTNGPRSQEMQVIYYVDDTQLYAALKRGEIEINTWELSKAQELDAKGDPNIILMKCERLGLRAFSMNNNITVPTYPGVVSAMSYVNFRKAIAHLVDKDYMRDVICEGAAVRTDVWCPSPSKDFWNWTIASGTHANGTKFTNYPYPFNFLQANLELNQTGFTYNVAGEDNPYYDSKLTGSAKKLRAYPTGHSKQGEKLDPLLFYSRSDDPLRDAAGASWRDYLLKSGIPVDFKSVPMSTCNTYVMLGLNYHIYTAGWSLGRYPLYLYSQFHSMYWFPGGSNYHCSSFNGYTDIDANGDLLNTALALPDLMNYAKKQQSLIFDKYCISISLWNSLAFYAVRNLCGVVNYFAVGPENAYTYLNSYRTDDDTKPIRVGIKSFPNQLSQMYSRWVWETSTMNPYQASFMSANPFEIFRDQPWLCRDWDIGTWVDPADGKTKSKITYYLRSDAEWIQPKTGAVLGGVNSTNYEFNVWYYYNTPDAWIYSAYKDVHHIRCDPDNTGNLFKIEVYNNVISMFDVYNPWGRDLYAPAWKQDPLCVGGAVQTKVFVTGVNLTTPGDITLLPIRTIGAPVEIVSVTQGATPLTKYTDYDMVLGRIRILKTGIPLYTTITVQYWARGDASGYIPGGLDWWKVHIGYGYFYMYEHVPGAGGWTSYKANRNFFLETAPLAEEDWYWYFVGTTKPRSGYYKVDIYDVTKTTAAYGGSGHLIPTVNWEVTADLMKGLIPPLSGDRPGKIDILDLATVQGQYGATFATPPSWVP